MYVQVSLDAWKSPHYHIYVNIYNIIIYIIFMQIWKPGEPYIIVIGLLSSTYSK